MPYSERGSYKRFLRVKLHLMIPPQEITILNGWRQEQSIEELRKL